MRVILIDDHPGRWNEGVEVVLCAAYNPVQDYPFVTCIRVGEPMGMFGLDEGPLQVLRYDEQGWHLTMSNLGVITEAERQTLLKEEEVVVQSYRTKLMLM